MGHGLDVVGKVDPAAVARLPAGSHGPSGVDDSARRAGEGSKGSAICVYRSRGRKHENKRGQRTHKGHGRAGGRTSGDSSSRIIAPRVSTWMVFAVGSDGPAVAVISLYLAARMLKGVLRVCASEGSCGLGSGDRARGRYGGSEAGGQTDIATKREGVCPVCWRPVSRSESGYARYGYGDVGYGCGCAS